MLFSSNVSKTDVRCATVGVPFFLTCKFIQFVLHVFMDGSKVQYKKHIADDKYILQPLCQKKQNVASRHQSDLM